MFDLQPLPERLPPLAGADDKTRSIVATLMYYDIFRYPPDLRQVVRFAHRAGSDGHIGPQDIAFDSSWWTKQRDFLFLRGRDDLAERRRQLATTSSTKLQSARRWARLLQVVPGVRFVGVTGSLSMGCAADDDDIDLLIITAADRVWSSRAMVLGLLWAAGVKRPDDDSSTHANQVCANIFLSETDLALPDRNLFIAHEICQMLPLLGPATYTRFVAANSWVCEYLPQWQPEPENWEDARTLRLFQRLFEAVIPGKVGRVVERALRQKQLERIQNKHLRGHNVGIRISPTQLRFHPRDLSDFVLAAYEQRWNSLCSNGHNQ